MAWSLQSPSSMKTITENEAVAMGESMARETAKNLKDANLLHWATEQFKAAVVAAKEGQSLDAKRLAAAGMMAHTLA